MRISRTSAIVLACVASALALLAPSAGARPAKPSAGVISAQELNLRQTMRKLWEDHITWTRMVIVDFAAGLPDLPNAEQRLLRNQTDIGNAIKPYYGAAAGAKLTALLRQHILEAVPVLAAAKAGNQAKLKSAIAAWYANANKIATFLHGANPDSWGLAMMKQMMSTHLKLTTDEAVARLQGHWAADIRAYDAVHKEILQMADMLSDGIVAQFPNKF